MRVCTVFLVLVMSIFQSVQNILVILILLDQFRIYGSLNVCQSFRCLLSYIENIDDIKYAPTGSIANRTKLSKLSFHFFHLNHI